MKKLILLAVLAITVQVFGQDAPKAERQREGRAQKMMQLSTEEIATLQTKKMTLLLDLNATQQDQIQNVNLENAKQRKAMMADRKAKRERGEKPTTEERYAMENIRLDHQIAMKEKMKSILNAEQYEKWEKARARMAMQQKGGMKKHMKENRP
ncbi:hypothetical protein V8G61_14810 [Gaetbulibacter sp. M240]|uniref:hypothetical protein n=1 Tax=Gaetbulibacter sp. M240 TaxID=3126511 RepID=UPI00374F9568